MNDAWKWASVKRVKEVAEEHKATILARYPDAQFALTRAPDDHHIWLLWTEVNVDDPDIVRQLTKEREVDLLVDDHVAVYVSPVRSLSQVFGRRPGVARKTG